MIQQRGEIDITHPIPPDPTEREEGGSYREKEREQLISCKEGRRGCRINKGRVVKERVKEEELERELINRKGDDKLKDGNRKW